MAHQQAEPGATPDSDSRDQQTPRRRRHEQSIKRRVIRLVLIPSVVALILWGVSSASLVSEGFINWAVAKGVRQVSIPSVPALASLQWERRLSIVYLAAPSTDLQTLLGQRQHTDEGLADMRAAAEAALGNAPESIQTQWTTFTSYLDKLPAIRSTVDSRSANRQAVYTFYNELLDAATTLFDIQARIVPDATAAQGGIVATDVFRVSDLMSRSASVIDGAFGANSLRQQEHLDFASLVGAYHAGLDTVAPHLHPDARKRYEALVASRPWQELIAAENELIAAGAWRNGPPRSAEISRIRWERLTRQVSAELVGLTVEQADKASARALGTGTNQLMTAAIGSLIALFIAIAAIVWAIRQSQVLVDRALSVRLAQLGRDAAAVVDEQLPKLLNRLRRGDSADMSVNLSHDYGKDEIGQVAAVMQRSLQAAAGAALNEASTRAAAMKMITGVARRPQPPLQRSLRIIGGLQKRVGDEDMLRDLFMADHQLRTARRFLENLIVLTGGQTGQRVQHPVPIRTILALAVGEAEQYQRVTIGTTPDLALVGHAVAGTVRLLAELLDNALRWSSPETAVHVVCSPAQNGLAIEIEDASVGMTPDVMDRANELLATAPTPDMAALKEGAQVGLHVVAVLAKRGGIRVSLRPSAYGGVRAIVLIPNQLIVAHATVDHTPASAPQGGSATSAGGADDGHQQDQDRAEPASPRNDNGSQRPPLPERPMTVHRPNIELEFVPPPPAYHDSRPTDAGASARPGSRPTLPTREPQQHLVPELRDALDGNAPNGTPPPRWSPEEAKRRYERYQQGRIAAQAASSGQPEANDDQGR